MKILKIRMFESIRKQGFGCVIVSRSKKDLKKEFGLLL
jgi:hypothetical protein